MSQPRTFNYPVEYRGRHGVAYSYDSHNKCYHSDSAEKKLYHLEVLLYRVQIFLGILCLIPHVLKLFYHRIDVIYIIYDHHR